MSTTAPNRMKRAWAAVCIIMLSMMALAVLPVIDNGKVYGVGETGQVTATTLNVRSGAGTSYSKLGTLKKGNTFTVTGTAKDRSGVTWYQFKYNSKTAYVSSKYVNIKSVTVTSLSNTTGTIKNGPLNVRSGPGTGYSKLGTMAKGKTFTVTGKAQDISGTWWYQFSFNGKTGYVCSTYVSVATAAVNTGSNVTAMDDTAATIKNGPLNVRSGPGTSYSKLGTVAKNSSVTVTGKAQDTSGTWWYQITYSGKTGYLCSTYVTLNEEGDANDTTSQVVTFQVGTINTGSSSLNVRTGAGTSYSKLGSLPGGSVVTITGSAKASNGTVWYTYQYSSSKVGYICSDYVTVKTVTSDNEFEAYLTSQGFPESYKAGLRALHAAHPQWVFKAVNVGYNWSTALSAESKVGINLVSSSSPTSYRSTASGAYNSSTKTWTKFDGSWYAANETVIAYYMDPRNFLTDSGIYQFMTHNYDSSSQNTDTVGAVVSGTFMETRNPGGGYSNFKSLINDAGKASGVNPNVLAAMIVQEQGTNGTSGLISGSYSGYSGYYNFFNVGAYTTSTMSAVQRGLWYAKQQGWNSVYKSVVGGAGFYSSNYVSKNQNTYYTKKFNVKNGSGSVATHQYMTNVAAAASEGSIVRKAYSSNSEYPVVFEIPVYNNMPASACTLP